MIIKEYYATREDGVILYRTYSNENFKIRKQGTNEIYDDAVDTADSSYQYEETDIKIEMPE